MKILMIGPFSPPITGNTLANDTLFEGIKNKNIQVDKINFSFPTLKEDLGKFSFEKSVHYLFKYRHIFKVFSSNKIYLTIGQTFYGVIKYALFIYLAKALKKDIIVHIHGNHLKDELVQLKNKKKRIMYNIISQFDKGIVLSESLKPNLLPFIEAKNIFCVHNFVEDIIIENTTVEKIDKKNSKELNIVFLSNLMTEKGIFDLLNALKILKKRGIKFKARIAGFIDPGFENEILRMIELLHNNVTYLGVVTGKDKLNLLLKANIFVFPTFYPMEGQPISILESMATGNIILTTKHAGIPDIFENKKNGFYIKKNNPEDIADKLEYFSKNLELLKPIMKNNYLEASKKYTTKKFIQKIVKIIEK